MLTINRKRTVGTAIAVGFFSLVLSVDAMTIRLLPNPRFPSSEVLEDERQYIATISVSGDGKSNCGYNSIDDNAGRGRGGRTREIFIGELLNQIRNQPNNDITRIITGYILEEIIDRSYTDELKNLITQIRNQNRTPGQFASLHLFSDIIERYVIYSSGPENNIMLANAMPSIAQNGEDFFKRRLYNLLRRSITDDTSEISDSEFVATALAVLDSSPANAPTDLPLPSLLPQIEETLDRITGYCSQIQLYRAFLAERRNSPILALAISLYDDMPLRDAPLPDDMTLNRTRTEIVREYLSLLSGSSDMMQISLTDRRGVADAIACMHNKHLLLIEGRKNHQQGLILHRFKHPRREDTPESAADTIFVVQQSDSHFVKGRRTTSPGQTSHRYVRSALHPRTAMTTAPASGRKVLLGRRPAPAAGQTNRRGQTSAERQVPAAAATMTAPAPAAGQTNRRGQTPAERQVPAAAATMTAPASTTAAAVAAPRPQTAARGRRVISARFL
ncbi:MAG: hypothetical protein LBO73_04285 [Holosporaceae bacterium]|nr:hypothetical protein [Holosporaceae bacterium]